MAVGVEWTWMKARPAHVVGCRDAAPGEYGNLGEVSVRSEAWPLSAGTFSTVVGRRTNGRRSTSGDRRITTHLPRDLHFMCEV